MSLPWQYWPLSFLGRIPRFPGKYRLADRWSRWCPDFHDVEVPGPNGLRFKVPSLKEPIALSLLINGVYEPDTLAFVRRILAPGDVYVDVGANVGAFALPATHCVGPTGRVVAIEGSACVIDYLRHNAAQPCPGPVMCVHAAVTAGDGGMVTFFDPPVAKFGMGSMAAWPGAEGYPVQGRSLDSILHDLGDSPVKLMKVDVEGFESDVFRGAERILGGTPSPVILFEFIEWAERRAGHAPGDAQRVLQSAGYHLWRLGEDEPTRPPLARPVVTGDEMLVARKVG